MPTRSADSKLEPARLRAQAAQGTTQTLHVGNGHLIAAASMSLPDRRWCASGSILTSPCSTTVTARYSTLYWSVFLIYTLSSSVMGCHGGPVDLISIMSALCRQGGSIRGVLMQ